MFPIWISIYFHYHGKIVHISIMCNIKEVLANRVCRWEPKDKLDKTSVDTSTCLRISVYKRLKRRINTKDRDKYLKISQITKIKKEGRKGANKCRTLAIKDVGCMPRKNEV